MSHLTIHFPDDHEELVVNSICRRFGYSPTVLDQDDNTVPNPVSPSEFAKDQVVNWIKSQIRMAEVDRRQSETELSVSESVDSIVFE